MTRTESNSTPGPVSAPVAPGPAVPPEGHERVTLK
jgi:hypothetical protein